MSGIGTLRICPLFHEKKSNYIEEEKKGKERNSSAELRMQLDLFKCDNEVFSLLRACIDMETNDFHTLKHRGNNVEGWERQHAVITLVDKPRCSTTTILLDMRQEVSQ